MAAKKPSRVPWTKREDEILYELKEDRELEWKEISDLLPGRTLNACRSRYQLLESKAAATNFGPFTEDEIQLLREEIEDAIKHHRTPPSGREDGSGALAGD
ncbi:hypothetical protein BC832DRAFT_590269 [Gaertneriomyces semiglobifer]|nr:hypothetical protein BC832DRAFT_590269 [Gaertneriomyces semiglobifer]